MKLSDAAYRQLFEVLPDGAFVVDLETGRFCWLNEATARLYGATREALWGAGALALAMDERSGQGLVRRELTRVDGGRFTAETATQVIEWEGRRLLVGVVRDASDRVRVERELQDSRALLANAFEHSPLMMAVADASNGRYLQVNDTFCRATGCSREELLGHTSLELGLVSGADRQRLVEAMTGSGRVAGMEITLLARHGPPRVLRMWGELLEEAGGRRIVTMAEDATERLVSERARDELHRRLEKVATRVPGVMFQLRREPSGALTLPWVSSQLRALFGVEPGEVVGDARLLLARFHPDDAPVVSEAVDRSAERLTLLQLEARLAPAGSTERWVTGSAAPEREPDGAITWNGFIADISDRKRSEAALRASQARFSLALEATGDAVWEWDHVRGNWASPNYGRMLGYGPNELSADGAAWRALIHPDDLDGVSKTIEPCLARAPDQYDLEYRMRAKSGEWRHVMARGKVVSRDATGRATRVVGTHVDVTDRARLRAEAAQRDRLANLGLLAAGVAHEVNNPLSWVLSNLELVTASVQRLTQVTTKSVELLARAGVDTAPLAPRDGALRELTATAEAALEGTQRLRNLSRALGSFVRVDDAPQELVDVNVALQTAATMAANELRFRAKLVHALQPVPPVRAVVGQVAQVFLNLLVHAAQALPEGRADEHLVTLRSWAEGRFVLAEVSDTGSAAAREGGTGLGLAIARDLVKDLRGELRVTSEEGKGTRVVVRLPAEGTTPEAKDAPATAHTPGGAKGRVLVVDDEPAIRRSLVRLLRDYEVVVAGNGREARAVLEKDQGFDVVLCDVSMPEVTGPELFAWLRGAAPALADRFVFLTGGSFNNEVNEAVQGTGAVQVAKPFDGVKLKAVVAERAAAKR